MTQPSKSKEVVYGCECNSEVCLVHRERDADTAPVIKLVKRNGKKIKVCSRCDLRSDKLIKWLVTQKHSFKPYFDYDPLVIGLGEQIPQ